MRNYSKKKKIKINITINFITGKYEISLFL